DEKVLLSGEVAIKDRLGDTGGFGDGSSGGGFVTALRKQARCHLDQLLPPLRCLESGHARQIADTSIFCNQRSGRIGHGRDRRRRRRRKAWGLRVFGFEYCPLAV